MIILQRSVGEHFNIGPDIRVTVIAVDARSIRLGIEAPVALLPHVEELHDRAAAQPDSELGKHHINWR